MLRTRPCMLTALQSLNLTVCGLPEEYCEFTSTYEACLKKRGQQMPSAGGSGAAATATATAKATSESSAVEGAASAGAYLCTGIMFKTVSRQSRVTG